MEKKLIELVTLNEVFNQMLGINSPVKNFVIKNISLLKNPILFYDEHKKLIEEEFLIKNENGDFLKKDNTPVTGIAVYSQLKCKDQKEFKNAFDKLDSTIFNIEFLPIDCDKMIFSVKLEKEIKLKDWFEFENSFTTYQLGVLYENNLLINF